MFCHTRSEVRSHKIRKSRLNGPLVSAIARIACLVSHSIDALEKPSSERIDGRMPRTRFGNNEVISIPGKKRGIKRLHETAFRQMHLSQEIIPDRDPLTASGRVQAKGCFTENRSLSDVDVNRHHTILKIFLPFDDRSIMQ